MPGRAHWSLHYGQRGKVREMSLGSAAHVSLAEARDLAAEARKLLVQGIDPIERRREQQQAAATVKLRATTFAEAVDAYIGAHEAGWKSRIHRKQWRSTLDTYAIPTLGPLAVTEVATEHVLGVLSSIWFAKPETASRVRGRIETVLSYAAARGWRDRNILNPAIWRGHLQLMLPPRRKVRAVQHHPALDWREAPAFMVELRRRDSFGARALEFAIVTVARSGEVRGALWNEIDFDEAVWTVPERRANGTGMKGGRPHRVPLNKPALAILREMAKLKDGSGLVFPGQKRGALLSDMTLTAVLRRMGRGELTAHGFRSTFRTWVSESRPGEEVEAAKASLAHTISDKVDGAYQRGALFEKRAALMADWAAFLARPAAEVVRLPRATAVLATGA